MADIVVSVTSSIVYEFLLLNKPVATFKNSSPDIQWYNSLKLRITYGGNSSNIY